MNRIGWAWAVVVTAAAGCGTDGRTPSCKDYPAPYDVRIPSRRAEEWPKLVELADEGCATLPAGFSTSGAAGQGGSSGQSGSGGSSGNTGTAGTSGGAAGSGGVGAAGGGGLAGAGGDAGNGGGAAGDGAGLGGGGDGGAQ